MRRLSSGGPSPDLGYPRDFNETFVLGKKLGQGGNGTVFVATRRADGAEFAVKVMPKILTDPVASERKREGHAAAIRREVEVLLALRGTLNVARLEGAWEDDRNAYLVLEHCRGGELLGGRSGHSASAMRRHPVSERAVASLVRSVLQTIAQCHARCIIHRDIKPENFLFASKDDGAALKAIDFGLAAFFTADTLPLTASTAEGTPWYLAPEACRGKWWPVTDVWAAGILAAYMLTGMYPFIDRVMPSMPDLARTLKVICYEELSQEGEEWEGVSSEARAFVAALLEKDPAKRPSATEALALPFVTDDAAARARPDRPLHHSVVQRMQRFAQNGVFKRKVLEHIARDLVSMHFKGAGGAAGVGAAGDASAHGSAGAEGSTRGGTMLRNRSMRGVRAFQEASRHGSVRGRDPSGSYRFAALASMGRAASSRDPSRRGIPSDGSVSRRGFGSVHSVRSGITAVVPAGAYLPVATPYSRRLAVLLDTLDTDADGKVERADLQTALQRMGYHLNEAEAGELFDVVDVERRGAVSKADMSASLVDWKWVQDTYADRWVEAVRHVFEAMDVDGDGQLDAAEIAAAFGGHLDPYEVDAAVHEALLEATGVNEEGKEGEGGGGKIDFQHLLGLLEDGWGGDDLGLFDDRLSDHSSRRYSGNIDDLLAAERRAKWGLLACCFGG